mmetsp:Transcript_19780/g.30531  ORF Transcript_19780/g.30531 Transcript_19780/m.30531 type:complete len:91 (+) Transcript_19780:1652-1924(+)
MVRSVCHAINIAQGARSRLFFFPSSLVRNVHVILNTDLSRLVAAAHYEKAQQRCLQPLPRSKGGWRTKGCKSAQVGVDTAKMKGSVGTVL